MPNTFGMSNSDKADVIAFNANGLGNSCVIEADGKCVGAPFKPEGLSTAECRELRAQGKINNCPFNSLGDYYAGAVKQCGGEDKIASSPSVANALYDELKKGDWETNSAALGLPSDGFTIWTTSVYMNNYNYTRSITQSGATIKFDMRGSRAPYTLCIVD